MNRKRLGTTPLELTRIGLGAWAIGGAWEYGWGPQDPKVSIAAIHRALEMGMNWIDTAPVYGLGRSEEIVGRALRESSYEPYIFTKCGIPWDEKGKPDHFLKRRSIETELDASCSRLDVDVIDCYQIHWPIPDEDIEEAADTLLDLQRQGRIRYVGVSNFSVDQLLRIKDLAKISVLQTPYSLIAPAASRNVLPFCKSKEIGVINYSPMGSGLLTGKVNRRWIDDLPADDWRRTKSDDFKEPRLSSNLAIADVVKSVSDRLDCFPGAVAIAWTLQNPAITGAIVGVRHPNQLDDLVDAVELELSPSDMATLTSAARELAVADL